MPLDRRDLRRRLFLLAAEQGGYFTAAQAKKLGYSYQAQAHHFGANNWLRIDRGVYRLTDWLPDIHDDLARWAVWSGGVGVISHETALNVHEIGEFESPRVHLTVPPGFRKRDVALRLHRHELPASHVHQYRNFRLTSPLRSIIDLAATAPDTDQLARAIDEALEQGRFTRRTLREHSEAVDPTAALYIERALQLSEAA